jgi:hypothetical protein
MFGFEYKKAPPTVHVILHQSGRVIKQGPGLSFWYFAPISTVVDVPLNSQDVSFIFGETTSDFQELTLQGQLIYRIIAPETAASVLDFSVDKRGRYLAPKNSQPLDLLGARLINTTQVAAQSIIRPLPVRDILKNPGFIATALFELLKESDAVAALGIQVIELALIAVSPSKETARALESETRELIQQQADQAIYSRRNAAVEEERRIKESELQTEVAVENKRREIRETRMSADIALEEKRKALITTQIENDRKEAESKAYALEVVLKQVQQVDWKTLLAVAPRNGDNSKMIMSLAFQELAQNAGKIGQLNLTPDLLQTLIAKDPPAAPPQQGLITGKQR